MTMSYEPKVKVKANPNETILPNSDKIVEEIYPVTEGLRAPSTKDLYRKGFKHFLDYIKIHDLQVLLDYSPKIIKSFIIDYVRHLKDSKQLKYRSIQVELSAIFHFFEMNDFDLSANSKKKIKRFLPSDESTHDDRPYTTEGITRIIAKCDERTRVIFLLMRSTGMRIGAIRTLQIGDLTQIEFQNVILYKVQIYARTRDKHISFCTPECYNAIQEYLQTSRRFGEEINDKTPLIREQFNIDDKLRIQYPKPISHRMVMYLVDQALKRSGVKTSEAMRSHAFRKGFKSICERSGMKSINVEMLLGHNIGVSGHYYRPADSDILEDYMTHAADALTIDPTQRLQKENQELRKAQKDYLAELGDLRHEFDKMKQL